MVEDSSQTMLRFLLSINGNVLKYISNQPNKSYP